MATVLLVCIFPLSQLTVLLVSFLPALQWKWDVMLLDLRQEGGAGELEIGRAHV